LTNPQQTSIHCLPPTERGGVEARHGFEVQDHVAAGLLIDLLDSMPLLEVWCETHDDITLIWQGQEGQEVEFVQVKSHELDQLWSVAKLCERERANKEALLGTSIFERSLANDRCCEPCRFRLVTCRPPSSSLGFLSLPLSAPDRMSKKDRLAELADDIDRRVGGFRSPKGNGALFWLANLIWEVRQSVESLFNDNNLRLLRLLAQKGVTLFPDQLSELYSGLLTKARDSALADWGRDPGKKRSKKLDSSTGWRLILLLA
jgi:Cap4 dsDNA endonuclease